jgi:hypothetical protein
VEIVESTEDMGDPSLVMDEHALSLQKTLVDATVLEAAPQSAEQWHRDLAQGWKHSL